MTAGRAAWGVATAAVLALVALAVVVRLGLAADPIPRLAGTAVWTTSRAAGVTAFAALTLDMLFGLAVSTGVLDRWVPRAASVDVHRWLAGIAIALVLGHALVLIADPTLRFDAVSALVPGLSPYRPAAVALGGLALYAALLLQLSFAWRKRIGARAWRALHFTSFGVFVAAVAHGLLAGSDASRPGLRALYATAGALVLALVIARASAVRSARRPAAAGSR